MKFYICDSYNHLSNTSSQGKLGLTHEDPECRVVNIWKAFYLEVKVKSSFWLYEVSIGHKSSGWDITCHPSDIHGHYKSLGWLTTSHPEEIADIINFHKSRWSFHAFVIRRRIVRSRKVFKQFDLRSDVFLWKYYDTPVTKTDQLKSRHGWVITTLIKCGLRLLNGATVEVWEWMNNFPPHFTGHVITSPCWGWS